MLLRFLSVHWSQRWGSLISPPLLRTPRGTFRSEVAPLREAERDLGRLVANSGFRRVGYCTKFIINVVDTRWHKDSHETHRSNFCYWIYWYGSWYPSFLTSPPSLSMCFAMSYYPCLSRWDPGRIFLTSSAASVRPVRLQARAGIPLQPRRPCRESRRYVDWITQAS